MQPLPHTRSEISETAQCVTLCPPFSIWYCRADAAPDYSFLKTPQKAHPLTRVCNHSDGERQTRVHKCSTLGTPPFGGLTTLVQLPPRHLLECQLSYQRLSQRTVDTLATLRPLDRHVQRTWSHAFLSTTPVSSPHTIISHYYRLQQSRRARQRLFKLQFHAPACASELLIACRCYTHPIHSSSLPLEPPPEATRRPARKMLKNDQEKALESLRARPHPRKRAVCVSRC